MSRQLLKTKFWFCWAAFTNAVAVEAQPVITNQPVGRTVTGGQTLSFRVDASGAQPIRYHWRKNGANIGGATNNILTIANVQQTDSGGYSAVALDVTGAAVSQVARLSVGGEGQATLDDSFGNSPFAGGPSGFTTADNTTATIETNEPVIGELVARKTVWFQWAGFTVQAPGIVTFASKGSDFDTLLGVFTGTDVTNLTLVGQDDDTGGFLTSQVTFNVDATTAFKIAVDGFAGATGNVGVNWQFVRTPGERIPIISRPPQNRSVPAGANVTFDVLISTNTPGPLTYQWFFNDQPIPNATTPALLVTNVQPGNAGRYRVRVVNPTNTVAAARTNFSIAAFLQLSQNAAGVQDVVAREKFAESVRDLGLRHNAGAIVPASVARGYVGTQVFSTYGATSEPGEPVHCGVGGGASQWFAYQAEANGTLTIDTAGSDFDTVLAVYTGSGTDFASLVSVACNNDDGTNTTSKVVFQAAGGTIYYIAVDGVGGQTGTVYLHYNLSGGPPRITAQPLSQTANAAANATFNVVADGAAPLSYQWRLNDANVTNATGATLALNNVQPANAGDYTVVVSNALGSATSVVATLTVNFAPVITQPPVSQTVAQGSNAILTVAASGTPAPTYHWQFNQADIGGATGATLTITNFQVSSAGNYRAVASNSLGVAISAAAELLLSTPLRVGSFNVSTNGTFHFRLVGAAGTNYVLEASTDLVDWVPLTTNSAPNGLLDFTDAAAANFRFRFYRALTWP